MEGRLTEKIDLVRSEGDQRDGFLEELLNRVDKAIKASNDAHDKLCEIGKMMQAQQNWNEKIGTFMADIG